MRAAAAVAVIVAGAALVWFFGHRSQAELAGYRFVPVERGDVEAVVASTGALQAHVTVQVGTQVSGQIRDIYVDFNDRVHKGQLIARIDPTLLQQEVLAAQAAVERSQAELEQARLESERVKRLFEGNAATEADALLAQYQFEAARASTKTAKVNLEKAQRNLGYTEIVAPVDGIVLERNVDVGQTVAASLSAPQLFLIAGDLARMEILANVDESDIGRIHDGQEARFTVQAYPDEFFQGKVRQVRLQSTMQENVVNYTVVIDVDNPTGRLLPGMTATVEFIVARETDVLKVANAALRFRPTAQMRQEMAKRREARASRGGDGDSGAAPTEGGRARWSGAGGNGNGNGRAGSADRAMLWWRDDAGQVRVTPVKTGITDGQSTVIEGPDVQEGMQVIAAVLGAGSASGGTNPFDSGRSGGGRPRPGF